MFLVTAAVGVHAGEPARFELRAGDRIALIGDGLIEQERRHGYLETRLTRRLPNGDLSFRNFGWAGDTVRGGARTSGFQNPEGFARLLKELGEAKPTIIFVGYGMNESFDGPAGLPGFRADYAKLLSKLMPLKARHIVLLSPTYQEDLGRPFPDPAEHNRHIAAYSLAIRKLAEDSRLLFVDLTGSLPPSNRAEQAKRWTTNGLQLNEAGSALVARAIEEQLKLPGHAWRVRIDVAKKSLAAEGTKAGNVEETTDGVRFRAADQILAIRGENHQLHIAGLRPGKYAIKADGRNVHFATAADLERGVEFTEFFLTNPAEFLRRAIVANNELFYRRWRPFNDHSRHWGFIGGDGELYDQQMSAQAKVIAERRRPNERHYDVVRIGDAK